MRTWAYLAILIAIIGAISGVALWYKSSIDAGWKARLAIAEVKAEKIESAAKIQTLKSNAIVEGLHAKLANAVNTVRIAEGCASQPLPADAIDILRALGLLDDSGVTRMQPGTPAGSTAPSDTGGPSG